MGDWGTRAANAFISKQHGAITSTIDPSKVRLPQPFVVCVVGASRGIGAGVAHAYAQAGASGLVLASRSVSGLEQTASECKKLNPNITIEVVPCDITNDASVRALAEKTTVTFERLDVLAINSGWAGPVTLKITETEPKNFLQATHVNYIGTFLCAKYFIPLLLATPNGARAIVAISSLAALLTRGPIANPPYCISKAAQLRLLEMIHEQYHESDGLVVYSVHPGAVASDGALETAPEAFVPYMTDSAELGGAYCVWLTIDRSHAWLSGRLCSANWDADELDGKKEVVVDGDLLRLKLHV